MAFMNLQQSSASSSTFRQLDTTSIRVDALIFVENSFTNLAAACYFHPLRMISRPGLGRISYVSANLPAKETDFSSTSGGASDTGSALAQVC